MAAPTQEAKLFWSEFQARYPEGAERVQQQVEKEHAEKRRAQGGLGELREACRTFFKSVSHEGLLEVCARLDYASTEAQELCYEPRAGQYVVKGSGGLWPEGGPQTKLEAMIDCRAVFDELRLAVFLRCPCLVEVESSLRGSDIDKEACQAMAAAVAAFREAPQQTTGHTGSFLSEASATYLAIVQDPSYYFSCDEIALIARERGLNVILAKELGRKQWVAEAVVHSGAGPFQAILLRGASGAGHVRTHFERLQRVANAGVADLTTERRHWWKCRVCSATFSSSILVPEGGVCCGHPVEEGVQQAGGPAGDAHAATLGQGPATPCEEPDARLPIPEWALPALRRKVTEVAAEEADADSRSEAGSGPTEAAGLQDSGAERSGKPKREKLPFAHGTDGTCEFERAVDLVLETYRSGGAVHAVELEALPFAALGQRLQDLVAAYEIDGIGSTEAVWLQPMIWQASFLPLAVLVEAWSRATGLPALFYMDAFHGLLLGLLHKDITTDVAGFKCRSRYWAVGTAQPGSGKSPAVDPMVEALQEVLEQHPDLAAGEAWDKFHICDPKTHCATVDKLRDADGYLTVVAGEGGPLLCPSWPSSATWNQTTHVNLQRFLNSANGGSVPWENAIERKGKKQAMEEQVRASPNVPGDRTNVSIVLFQQCSVFSNWWAAGELKQAIGLPQRCVFSFGAVREPGPPWLQGFESEVVIPLLKRGFLWILKTLGPKAPLSDRTPGLSWRLGSVCRDVFWR
ncbi:unnamed protein product [Effrenium voratum]|uniref:Uncharacterized protein n=1 Tax=Effrenium voratum TaxID=2562239 RepID=A0AA36ICC6_9DINO|nr:unnamed protein product [Effrenium voratum]